MKVLLLTTRPNLFSDTLKLYGDTYEVSMARPDVWPDDVDFVVSYGYRHIIKEPYLSEYKYRMINVHLSLLPWNKGADPNFWSWFDRTPKGVSIHLITAALDAGPIIMQMNITKWRERETLKSSYEFLQQAGSSLFHMEWGRFREQRWFYLDPVGEGSLHKSADKTPYMNQLPLGWETPVSEVERLGDEHRATKEKK